MFVIGIFVVAILLEEGTSKLYHLLRKVIAMLCQHKSGLCRGNHLGIVSTFFFLYIIVLHHCAGAYYLCFLKKIS
jgi:hypothetical protein